VKTISFIFLQARKIQISLNLLFRSLSFSFMEISDLAQTDLFSILRSIKNPLSFRDVSELIFDRLGNSLETAMFLANLGLFVKTDTINEMDIVNFLLTQEKKRKDILTQNSMKHALRYTEFSFPKTNLAHPKLASFYVDDPPYVYFPVNQSIKQYEISSSPSSSFSFSKSYDLPSSLSSAKCMEIAVSSDLVLATISMRYLVFWYKKEAVVKSVIQIYDIPLSLTFFQEEFYMTCYNENLYSVKVIGNDDLLFKSKRHKILPIHRLSSSIIIATEDGQISVRPVTKIKEPYLTLKTPCKIKTVTSNSRNAFYGCYNSEIYTINPMRTKEIQKLPCHHVCAIHSMDCTDSVLSSVDEAGVICIWTQINHSWICAQTIRGEKINCIKFMDQGNILGTCGEKMGFYKKNHLEFAPHANKVCIDAFIDYSSFELYRVFKKEVVISMIGKEDQRIFRFDQEIVHAGIDRHSFSYVFIAFSDSLKIFDCQTMRCVHEISLPNHQILSAKFVSPKEIQLSTEKGNLITVKDGIISDIRKSSSVTLAEINRVLLDGLGDMQDVKFSFDSLYNDHSYYLVTSNEIVHMLSGDPVQRIKVPKKHTAGAIYAATPDDLEDLESFYESGYISEFFRRNFQYLRSKATSETSLLFVGEGARSPKGVKDFLMVFGRGDGFVEVFDPFKNSVIGQWSTGVDSKIDKIVPVFGMDMIFVIQGGILHAKTLEGSSISEEPVQNPLQIYFARYLARMFKNTRSLKSKKTLDVRAAPEVIFREEEKTLEEFFDSLSKPAIVHKPREPQSLSFEKLKEFYSREDPQDDEPDFSHIPLRVQRKFGIDSAKVSTRASSRGTYLPVSAHKKSSTSHL
jgi:hypothetical protein